MAFNPKSAIKKKNATYVVTFIKSPYPSTPKRLARSKPTRNVTPAPIPFPISWLAVFAAITKRMMVLYHVFFPAHVSGGVAYVDRGVGFLLFSGYLFGIIQESHNPHV